MAQSSQGTTTVTPALPAELPEDLRGFNFGAFFLQWVWGIRHKVTWAWWSLIPGVNIIIAIMLGLRGNELAWKNVRWKNEVEFDVVQTEWTMVGGALAIAFGLLVGLAVLCVTAHNAFQYEIWGHYTPR